MNDLNDQLNAERDTIELQSMAIEAIGFNENDEPDYILAPKNHIVDLQKRQSENQRSIMAIGPLLRVLETKRVAKVANDYEREDRKAGIAQKWYLRLSRISIWFSALGVSLAGFLAVFLPREWIVMPLMGFAEFWVIILVLFLVAIATSASVWIRSRKLYRAWVEARGNAENLRKELFEVTTRTEAAEINGEIPALLLKLEYFRRYQLDVQKDYFKSKSQSFSALARRSGLWDAIRTIVYFVLPAILIAIALAPIAEQQPVWHAFESASGWAQLLGEADWAKWLLLVIIVIAALHSGFLAESLLIDNQRNAIRYANMKKNLLRLEESGLERAREAARQGDLNKVLMFIRAIHNLMSAEFQEWVILTDAEANLLTSGDRLGGQEYSDPKTEGATALSEETRL